MIFEKIHGQRGVAKHVQYTNGIILSADGIKAYVIYGRIYNKWRDIGGLNFAGYPTMDESKTTQGTYQKFSLNDCRIYCPSNKPPIEVYGAIAKKYINEGGHNGWLGYPAETSLIANSYEHKNFNGGVIYKRPNIADPLAISWLELRINSVILGKIKDGWFDSKAELYFKVYVSKYDYYAKPDTTVLVNGARVPAAGHFTGNTSLSGLNFRISPLNDTTYIMLKIEFFDYDPVGGDDYLGEHHVEIYSEHCWEIVDGSYHNFGERDMTSYNSTHACGNDSMKIGYSIHAFPGQNPTYL